MFGLGRILESVVDVAVSTVEDVVDIGTSVVTLGAYGELSSENVTRLLATGLTIYELSELTGVAMELLQEVADD